MTQLGPSFSHSAVEEPAPASHVDAPDVEEFEPLACGGAAEAGEIARRIIKIIERNDWHFDHDYYRVFSTFIEIADYAISGDEDAYMQAVGRLKREAVNAVAEMFGELRTMWSDYVFADVLGIVYTVAEWRAADPVRSRPRMRGRSGD